MFRHSSRLLPVTLSASAVLVASGVVGAALYRGMRKGRASDDAPGRSARRSFGRYALVGRSVTIAKPREELFRYWRDFPNLASFMENLLSVEPVEARDGPGEDLAMPSAERFEWTIRGPASTQVKLHTAVVREIENELIAWRSVEGSDIETEGRVAFEEAPGERGTRVGLIIAYHPPGGAAGQTVARLLRREPEVQARHDLKRFKMLMETGEIATSARRTNQNPSQNLETG